MTTFRAIADGLQNPPLPLISIWPSIWSTYKHTREIISVGPQLFVDQDEGGSASSLLVENQSQSSAVEPIDTENGSSKKAQAQSDATFTFLDSRLSKNGPNSVIYICFGSEFHPPTAPQVEMLYDELERHSWNVVYVSSGESKENEEYFGDMPVTANDVLVKRTKGLGERGHVVEWCDQWNVLAHPVSHFSLMWRP